MEKVTDTFIYGNGFRDRKTIIHDISGTRTIYYREYPTNSWNHVHYKERPEPSYAGHMHREDGPAFEQQHPDGSIEQDWYRHGKPFREDGPVSTKTGPNDTYELWKKDGTRHRVDGPAQKLKFSDGRTAEYWMQNDELHRLDGPARIEIDKDGNRFEEYWRFGLKIPVPTRTMHKARIIPALMAS